MKRVVVSLYKSLRHIFLYSSRSKQRRAQKHPTVHSQSTSKCSKSKSSIVVDEVKSSRPSTHALTSLPRLWSSSRRSPQVPFDAVDLWQDSVHTCTRSGYHG